MTKPHICLVKRHAHLMAENFVNCPLRRLQIDKKQDAASSYFLHMAKLGDKTVPSQLQQVARIWYHSLSSITNGVASLP
ncbi:MAG: hypothetical protein WCA08_22750, partial [Desulfoferrobacter sp.]